MGDKLDLQKKDEFEKGPDRIHGSGYTPNKRKCHQNRKKQRTSAYSLMISKRAVFDQQEALYKDLLEQIKQCHVIAEHSGIVVYTVPEQTRMGSGATQSIIAQGEPVQYGQKMMSIPDLSHMLVNVRVHEAFINHMEVEARVDSVIRMGPPRRPASRPGTW